LFIIPTYTELEKRGAEHIQGELLIKKPILKKVDKYLKIIIGEVKMKPF